MSSYAVGFGELLLNYLCDNACIQLFYREYQVPVLSPNYVATVNGETAELTGVKIFVVLWVRVTANEVANINHSGGIVAECQANGKIACILCFCDVNSLHSPPYSFLLILVLRTLCFKTKNFTHF